VHVEPGESGTEENSEYYFTPKGESIFESPEQLPLPPSCDEEDMRDDEAKTGMPEEKEERQFATHNFGTLASQYITPYLYSGGSNLDREYGMRRDQDRKFRVGNLKIEIDIDSNIFIANKEFKEKKACLNS
jgi:hypothetical protein